MLTRCETTPPICPAAVPGADAPETTRLAVAEGVVLSEAEAEADAA